MLALYADEGAKGMAAMWFLFSRLRARGAWLRDPFHRMWRDWNLAVGEVGWTSTVHEGLIFLNFRFAPWLSQGFWSQLLEALQSWCEKSHVSDLVFGMLYPLSCQDKQVQDCAAYGAP